MSEEQVAIKIIEAHPELAGTEELARMIDAAIKSLQSEIGNYGKTNIKLRQSTR